MYAVAHVPIGIEVEVGVSVDENPYTSATRGEACSMIQLHPALPVSASVSVSFSAAVPGGDVAYVAVRACCNLAYDRTTEAWRQELA